jgi:hypothetical protein
MRRRKANAVAETSSASARWRRLAALLTPVLLVGCGREPCQRLLHTRFPAEEEVQSLSSEPEPRCRSDEPACGPQPFDSSDHACFQASKPRKRLPAGESRHEGGREAACAHDGDCRIAGCGGVCVHYSLGRITTDCEGYDWLDENAFCGCLDKACAFFEQ